MKTFLILILASLYASAQWETSQDGSYQYQVLEGLTDARFLFSESGDSIFIYNGTNKIKVDYQTGILLEHTKWNFSEYTIVGGHILGEIKYKLSNDLKNIIIEYTEKVEHDRGWHDDKRKIVALDSNKNILQEYSIFAGTEEPRVSSNDHYLNYFFNKSNFGLLISEECSHRYTELHYYYRYRRIRIINEDYFSWINNNKNVKSYNDRIVYNYYNQLSDDNYKERNYDSSFYQIDDYKLFAVLNTFDIDSNYFVGINTSESKYYYKPFNDNNINIIDIEGSISEIKTTNNNRVIGFYQDTVKVFTKDNFELLGKYQSDLVKSNCKYDVHKEYLINYRNDTLYKFKPELYLETNSVYSKESTESKDENAVFKAYYTLDGRLVSRDENTKLEDGLYLKIYLKNKVLITDKIFIKN